MSIVLPTTEPANLEAKRGGGGGGGGIWLAITPGLVFFCLFFSPPPPVAALRSFVLLEHCTYHWLENPKGFPPFFLLNSGALSHFTHAHQVLEFSRLFSEAGTRNVKR